MADAAVEFLLENLKQLLVYNVNLISDVKNQVESLYNQLGLFKAFLKDSTEKRRKNEVLKELVKQIRDVVYDAEDVIDAFVAEAAAHKARRSVWRTFQTPAHAENLRKVAGRIQDIRRRVDEIYERKQFGFELLQTKDGDEGSSEEKKDLLLLPSPIRRVSFFPLSPFFFNKQNFSQNASALCTQIDFTLYEGLLRKLPEMDKAALQRTMGLKFQQLKGELQQLDD